MIKRCLCPPPAEVFEAVSLLEQAAEAHLRGDDAEAKMFIKKANDPKVRQWTESLWGANSPYVKPVKVELPLPHLPKESRVKVRMPTTFEAKKIHERDGYNCRVCGVPLITKRVRDFFNKKYHDINIWSNQGNNFQHAGFQAVWLQYDHVVPHARGGGNDFDNIIITCAPCNYSRMSYTFEEIGLPDPRNFDPIKSDWDGLERVFNKPG